MYGLHRYSVDSIGSIAYEKQGLRIVKKVGSATTKFYYFGTNLIAEVAPSYRLDFLYDENGQLYGFIKDNAIKFFYVKDCLGTILGIVNESGTLVAQYTYTAFGKCTAVGTSGIGTINPFRFKGYYYDTESGMYYCHTRYFVPGWGRWLNADNINYLNTGNLSATSLYSYCYNDPLNYYDDNGEKSKKSNFQSRKPKRHGSEKRQPGGLRERNIGHPNGEEHSRRPKGGFRPKMVFAGNKVISIYWENSFVSLLRRVTNSYEKQLTVVVSPVGNTDISQNIFLDKKDNNTTIDNSLIHNDIRDNGLSLNTGTNALVATESVVLFALVVFGCLLLLPLVFV